MADEPPFISAGLFLIDLPYACFGIEATLGRVVTAPPIARWMRGKDLPTIRLWVFRKGGTIVEVEQ